MSIFDIWRKKDDTVPGPGAGNIMQWHDYHMVRDSRTDGTQAPPDDVYGTYRRKSGREAGDTTSTLLNDGRATDSTRVQPGSDKTTPDDTVWRRR